MKKIIIKFTASMLLLTFAALALAQDKLSFRANLFNDNTGTTVQSPAVELVKKLTGKLEFLLRYSLDRVIIPPVRGLAATPTPADGVTGASRPVGGEDPAN